MPGSSMLPSVRAIRFLPPVLMLALIGCGGSGSSTQPRGSNHQGTASTQAGSSHAKPKPAKGVPGPIRRVVIRYAKLRATGRPEVCGVLATQYLEKVSGKGGAQASKACLQRKHPPDASFATPHLVITAYRRLPHNQARIDAANSRFTHRLLLVREGGGWKILGASAPRPR